MLIHLPEWLRTLRTHSTARRRRLSAAHSIEALEFRTMLAGNVTAVIEDGTLILTGDGADNSVEVLVVDGDIVVRGRDNTTINGVTSPFAAATDTTTFEGDVMASLAGGADTLRITGPLTVSGTTHITDADGPTQVGITDATLDGAVHIATGDADDAVSIAGATLGDHLSLSVGGGANQISVFESTIAGRVSVSTGTSLRQFSPVHDEGESEDDSTIRDGRREDRQASLQERLDARRTRQHLSDGENDIVIEDSTIGSLSLRVGSGADDVIVQNSTVDGNMHAGTGAGEDFVMFDDATVTGQTVLNLGRGDDALATQNTNTFEGRFRANGKSRRSDAAGISEETVFKRRSLLKRFEESTVPDTTIATRGTATLTAAAQLRTTLNEESDDGDTTPPTLTIDTSNNADTVQSNDTLVTTRDEFHITGQTAAGATVEVAAGPGGVIDLGSTTADTNGNFSIDIDLLAGGTNIIVTATNDGGSASEEFNLHRAVGSVVRFISSEGTFDVEMLNEDAPLTVANFESYFNRYVNSFIHRAGDGTGGVPSVIQGGGFTFDAGMIEPITADPPIVNEFDPTNSNLEGTLSMALTGDGQGGTDPDSGTSQWFINLSNNVFLDAAQHTVFGRIIGSGLDVARAIQDLPRFDITASVESPPVNGFDPTDALTDVPLDGYTEFSEALPGTVSIDANSIIVNGTGTNFLSTLEPGEIVRINGVNRAVLEVTSDTMLTLTSSPTTAVTDATVFVNPVPEDDELVLFLSIFELLPEP